MKSAFEGAHKARFGFIDADQAARGRGGLGRSGRRRREILRTGRRDDRGRAPRAGPHAPASIPAATGTTPPCSRASQLAPGHKVTGPAIVIEPHQTVVVEHGWQAEITAKNHLVLERVVALPRAHAIGTQADPVMLEVFNNLFMSIAEQMGVSLQNTAYSVNIKERLDFSCAVFATGRHAGRQRTAHAGASWLDGPRGRDHHPREQGQDRARRRLPASTRPTTAARTCPTSRSARRSTTRTSARSCSGSPRAAITPMSAASRRARCRRSPPPSRKKASTSTISSWSTAAASARRSSTTLLTGAKYPARNPLQNVNDLKAQIAANEKGVQELHKMVAQFTPAGRARLHEARAGQRRRKRAARASTGCTTARSPTRWTRAR